MSDLRPRVLLIAVDSSGGDVGRAEFERWLGDRFALRTVATAADGLTRLDVEPFECAVVDDRVADIASAGGADALHALIAGRAAVVVVVGDAAASGSGASGRLARTALTAESLRSAVEAAIERRQLSAALDTSERLSSALLEVVPDTVYRIHRDGTVMDASAGDEGDDSYRAQVVGRPLAEVFPREVAERAAEAIERALTERRVQVFDWRLGDDSGERVFVTRVSASHEDQVVMLTRDLTDQHRVEEQMRAAQRMEAVGRLASGVAHDFCNLLTVIHNYVQFVAKRLGPDHEAQADIDVIQTAVDRSVAVTSQLLTFSRRKARKPKALSINAKLRDLELLIRRLIGAEVDLTMDLDDGLGLVRADPAQIDQVIMNLAVNARDAMPRGGALSISTHNTELSAEDLREDEVDVWPGYYIRMSVADTGVGIDEQALARIFEPFFTTKHTGSGLGLSTVWGIVRQSQGIIRVGSTPGKGTAFDIYLPRAEEHEVTNVHHRLLTLAELEGTETVLVVEDEDAVRAAARRILEQHGYRVLAAKDGNDAVAVSLRHEGDINLVVVDVVMPRMNGPALVKALRDMRPEARVLYITGYADDSLTHRDISGRYVGLLEKPFTTRSLLTAVRDALEDTEEQTEER